MIRRASSQNRLADRAESADAKLGIVLTPVHALQNWTFENQGGEVEPKSAFKQIPVALRLIPFELHRRHYTLQAYIFKLRFKRKSPP